MRIVFLGSPEPVIAPLAYLLEEKCNVVGVVSQPAKPFGRGGKLMDPPVALFAKEKNLAIAQPASAKDPEFLDWLRKLNVDVCVTAAYGQILSQEFLDIPHRGTINIHPSLLPLYRGATPVQTALLDGAKETGVSILFTVKKLDAGNIIMQERFAIHPDETSGALMTRMFLESGPLLYRSLEQLSESPSFDGTPQDESKVTHCKKIAKEDGLVRWQSPQHQIYNQIRAYSPWPGTFTFCGGIRVQIVSALRGQSSSSPGVFSFDKKESALRVGTNDLDILVKRIKPAGSKEMDAAAFWNGLKIPEDQRRFDTH